MARKARQRGVRGGGSLHKDELGYWVAAINLPAGPDGERRRLVRKSKVSPADARAKLDAAVAGGPKVDRNVTVSEWLAFWRAEILPTSVKPRTLVAYANCCRMWIEPHLGGVRLVELGPEHITRMLNKLEAAGLSAGTRCHVRDVLSTALNKAERWQKLPQGNPTRLTDKPRRRPVRDEWTAQEAAAILAAAAGDRMEAFAVVMLHLGLRPFEALALRWEDVDLTWPDPSLEIVESKTEAGQRLLPLSANVTAALRAHRRRQRAERLAAPYWHDPGLVFCDDIGAAIDYRRMGDWWGRIVAAAGLEHRRLYSARHTAATLMLNNGVDLEVVSAILGHASLAITADVYAHVGPELKRGAADIMDDVLR